MCSYSSSKQRERGPSPVLIHCERPPSAKLSRVISARPSYSLLTTNNPCNLSPCQGQTPLHALTHGHLCLHLLGSVCVRLCTQSSSGVCAAGGRMTRLNTQYDAQAARLRPGARLSPKTAEVTANARLHVFAGRGPSPRSFNILLPFCRTGIDWSHIFAHFTLHCHHRQTFCCCVPPQVLRAERVLLRQTQGRREGGLPQHPVLGLAWVFNWFQRAVEEAQQDDVAGTVRFSSYYYSFSSSLPPPVWSNALTSYPTNQILDTPFHHHPTPSSSFLETCWPS